MIWIVSTLFESIILWFEYYGSYFNQKFLSSKIINPICLVQDATLPFCFIACFTSDRQTSCSLFKLRNVIWLINYDIVKVGICSEPLMRLSYNIHLGYGKDLRRTWESNLGPPVGESPTLPLTRGRIRKRSKAILA